MKYKVGDRVKIREDLKNGVIFNGRLCDGFMVKLAGTTATISNVLPKARSYKIEGSDYFWGESMLEDLTDVINHPAHYKNGEIETIDIIKNNVRDFNSYIEGNIIKYISRYRHKNGVEDLKKARWYLDKLIEEVEVQP